MVRYYLTLAAALLMIKVVVINAVDYSGLVGLSGYDVLTVILPVIMFFVIFGLFAKVISVNDQGYPATFPGLEIFLLFVINTCGYVSLALLQ